MSGPASGHPGRPRQAGYLDGVQTLS